MFLGDGRNHRISGYSTGFKPPLEAEFNGELDDEHITGLFKRWVVNDVPRKATSVDVFSLIAMRARGHDGEFYHGARERGRDLKELFEALRMMLLSPWWSRMWVFQEAILARKLTVRYGGTTCPWKMFQAAAHQQSGALTLVSHSYRKVLEYFSKHVRDVAHITPNVTHPQNAAVGMLALLRQTSERKALDDRDKVFALLGLVPMKDVIFPSYAVPTEDVYTITVSQIIARGKSLAPLYGDLGRKNRKDLPSWVPDWSAVMDQQEIRRVAYTNLYNACANDRVEYISSIDHLRTYALKQPIYYGFSPSAHHWLSKPEHVRFNRLKYMELLAKTRCYSFIGLVLFKPVRISSADWPDSLQQSLGTGPDPEPMVGEQVPAPLWIDQVDVSKTGDASLRQYKRCHLLGRHVATVKEVGETIVGPITPSELQRLCQSYKELTRDDRPIRPHSLRALAFYCKAKDGQIVGSMLSENDDDTLQRWFESRLNIKLGGPDLGNQDLHEPNETDPLELDEVIRKMANRRRLFIAGDRLGWGPTDTQPGDHVYVLPGGRVPFVLRQAPEIGAEHTYRLIGDCLLQDAMNGETCQDVKWEAVLLPPLSWTGCGLYMKRNCQDRNHHQSKCEHQLECERHLLGPLYSVIICLKDHAEANNLVMVTLI